MAIARIEQTLERWLPSLEMFTAYILAEMESKKSILIDFATSLEQKTTNTVKLAELLSTEKLDGIEVRDATVSRVKRINDATIQLTMKGEVGSNSTKVFQVKHLNYYTNWHNNATRHEYVGRNLLVWNEGLDCVKAVGETTVKHVGAGCNIKNFQDPNLKTWRETVIPDISKEIRGSQVIRSGSEFIISCWGNSIEIAYKDAKKAFRTPCPTYPFRLNDSYSFRTSDDRVSHKSKKMSTVLVKPLVVMDVAEFHFNNYKAAHEVINEQTDQINNLLVQADRLGAEANATLVYGKQVTWKQIGIGSFSSTAGLMVIMIICYTYKRCKGEYSPWKWISKKEWDRREDRRMEHLPRRSEDINANIQREVSRQSHTSFNQVLANRLQAVGYEFRPTPLMTTSAGRRPSCDGNYVTIAEV